MIIIWLDISFTEEKSIWFPRGVRQLMSSCPYIKTSHSKSIDALANHTSIIGQVNCHDAVERIVKTTHSLAALHCDESSARRHICRGEGIR